MPVCNIIKLKQLSPLHLGTGKIDQYDFSASDLHSDTLSAALAAIRAQQGKASDTEDFLLSFSISSAFPYYNSSYFLPNLKGYLPIRTESINGIPAIAKSDSPIRKENIHNQLKYIKYIDFPLWNRIASGDEISIDEVQLKSDFLLSLWADFDLPYKSVVSQRIQVPKDSADAHPFFFNWTYFHEKAGLFCFTDATDEKFDELLHLFRELGEAGLGADRTVGGGQFEVENDTLQLPDIAEANYIALLSLYIPEESEIKKLNLKSAKYGLLQRGGFIAGSSEESLRHLRKRTVYMFDTGSLFPTTEPLHGKIVNLRPVWNDERLHPVYRSGRPFYLPVKINEI